MQGFESAVDISYITLTQQKMTFLTANYGLSAAQVEAFADGLGKAYWSHSAEIEQSWAESGWKPENPAGAMIECLVDADRLEDFLDDYEAFWKEWLFKQELAYDLYDVDMPLFLTEYLRKNNMTWWNAA